MKPLDSIAIIVQARLNSERVPQKMIKPFAGTTLFDIVLDKIKTALPSKQDNIWASVYEPELIEIAKSKSINVFNRSKTSANNDNSLQTIYEWHDKLPFKYVIAINPCTPLIEVETIESFIKSFIDSDQEGAFSVFEKQTYYWGKDGKMITDWPEGQQMFNTKFVDPIYEAAHVLYASRLDIIKRGYYITDKLPVEPHLFVINELEAFDIDYDHQFKVAEQLYKINKEDV